VAPRGEGEGACPLYRGKDSRKKGDPSKSVRKLGGGRNARRPNKGSTGSGKRRLRQVQEKKSRPSA